MKIRLLIKALNEKELEPPVVFDFGEYRLVLYPGTIAEVLQRTVVVRENGEKVETYMPLSIIATWRWLYKDELSKRYIGYIVFLHGKPKRLLNLMRAIAKAPETPERVMAVEVI